MNRPAPIDLPDDIEGRVPGFRSRRKAELLPPLRPAVASNGFDRDFGKGVARPSRPVLRSKPRVLFAAGAVVVVTALLIAALFRWAFA